METAPSLAFVILMILAMSLFYTALGILVSMLAKSFAPAHNTSSSDQVKDAIASGKAYQAFTTLVLCSSILGGFGGVILWLTFNDAATVLGGIAIGFALSISLISLAIRRDNIAKELAKQHHE